MNKGLFGYIRLKRNYCTVKTKRNIAMSVLDSSWGMDRINQGLTK